MANNNDVELGDVEIVDQTVQFFLACEGTGHDCVHRPSIFKVPSILKDIDPDSYNPKVVSIGPFHREDQNVQAMEARKFTYLYNLLACLELPREETLKTFLEKVTASLSKIKGSYAEMKSYTHLELAKMMVMDGFFILDFFYNCEQYSSDLLQVHIPYDLLLVENQIPFFVLRDIFECTILKCQPYVSLIGLILCRIKSIHLFVPELREENLPPGTSPDHILGLLHDCYLPKIPILPTNTANFASHSIVELVRAGVSFKPNQDPSWPMAIEVELSRIGCFFWASCKPTVKMPVLFFHDPTGLFIRNLAVYELSSSLVPNYFTSYISVLDGLIDTREDIDILTESGILINILGSNEEAANMVNSILKRFPAVYGFHNTQLQQLDGYYNGYWPKNLAGLRRTYFNSPWSIIAIIAGIVLFALTIVQTIFTVNPV